MGLRSGTSYSQTSWIDEPQDPFGGEERSEGWRLVQGAAGGCRGWGWSLPSFLQQMFAREALKVGKTLTRWGRSPGGRQRGLEHHRPWLGSEMGQKQEQEQGRPPGAGTGDKVRVHVHPVGRAPHREEVAVQRGRAACLKQLSRLARACARSHRGALASLQISMRRDAEGGVAGRGASTDPGAPLGPLESSSA